jgi:hypothetical protein
MKKTVLTAFAVLAALTATASAKDKMDKVDIARDGIDVRSVVVKAGSNGYTAIEGNQYVFSVRGYAAAKKGFRILGAWFHTGKLEQAHVYSLLPRDYGSGEKRTLKFPISYKVPMNKVVWDGASPLDACRANLAKLKQSGFTEKQILAKSFSLKVDAIVGFTAVADREWREASPVGLGGGSTWKSRTMRYEVAVECAARP